MIFGTMAGASVVLMGALYALFFALGRLNTSQMFMIASMVSYLLLAGSVYVLIEAFALRGFWVLVTIVMLVGYFLLPRAIWKLCTGTHAGEIDESQSRESQ